MSIFDTILPLTLLETIMLFEKLPDEIILKILSYMDISDLNSVIRTSKHLQNLGLDNHVWASLCKRDYGFQPRPEDAMKKYIAVFLFKRAEYFLKKVNFRRAEFYFDKEANRVFANQYLAQAEQMLNEFDDPKDQEWIHYYRVLIKLHQDDNSQGLIAELKELVAQGNTEIVSKLLDRLYKMKDDETLSEMEKLKGELEGWKYLTMAFKNDHPEIILAFVNLYGIHLKEKYVENSIQEFYKMDHLELSEILKDTSYSLPIVDEDLPEECTLLKEITCIPDLDRAKEPLEKLFEMGRIESVLGLLLTEKDFKFDWGPSQWGDWISEKSNWLSDKYEECAMKSNNPSVALFLARAFRDSQVLYVELTRKAKEPKLSLDFRMNANEEKSNFWLDRAFKGYKSQIKKHHDVIDFILYFDDLYDLDKDRTMNLLRLAATFDLDAQSQLERMAEPAQYRRCHW